MAFVHGKKSFVELDSLDISDFTDSAELSRTLETALVSAFGDCANEYIPGMKDSTFTMSGSWDGADGAIDEKLDSVYNGDAAVTLKYGPNGDGATTGDVVYTLSVIITDAPITSGVGDKVAWSATFQATGEITRAVTP